MTWINGLCLGRFESVAAIGFMSVRDEWLFAFKEVNNQSVSDRVQRIRGLNGLCLGRFESVAATGFMCFMSCRFVRDEWLFAFKEIINPFSPLIRCTQDYQKSFYSSLMPNLIANERV
jgi:hypothetical protein